MKNEGQQTQTKSRLPHLDQEQLAYHFEQINKQVGGDIIKLVELLIAQNVLFKNAASIGMMRSIELQSVQIPSFLQIQQTSDDAEQQVSLDR